MHEIQAQLEQEEKELAELPQEESKQLPPPIKTDNVTDRQEDSNEMDSSFNRRQILSQRNRDSPEKISFQQEGTTKGSKRQKNKKQQAAPAN